MLYCVCTTRVVPCKNESERFSRQVPSYADEYDQYADVFSESIVDLYIEAKRGKKPLLVVVGDSDVKRIDMSLIPFLQPKDKAPLATVSIPYVDASLAPMVVPVPVAPIGETEMVWRTSQEMAKIECPEDFYMQSSGWGRNTISKILHDHQLKF